MDWLTNPLIIGSAGAVIVALIPMFLKNEKVGNWGEAHGGIVGKIFWVMNIPVITGKAEETVKEKLLLTGITYAKRFIVGLEKSAKAKNAKD